MLHKKVIFLFFLGLNCGALQSMDSNDLPDFTPSDNGVARLTDEFVGLTTVESDDSTDSDEFNENHNDETGPMNLAAAHIQSDLDYSDDFMHSRLDSSFEPEILSSAISSCRKSVDESFKYDQKASAGLQSPAGLQSGAIQSAMYGIPTNASAAGQATAYNLRSSKREFGEASQSKENLKKARISESNQVISQKIGKVLEGVKERSNTQKKNNKKLSSILNTPEQASLIKYLKQMQNNTSCSRQNASIGVLSVLQTCASGNKKGDIVQDNGVFRDILQSDDKAAPVALAAASALRQDEIRPFAYVNADHVAHGEISDNNGTPVLNSGLHSLERCIEQGLFDFSKPIFIGQDQQTIGLFVNGAQKTMRSKLNEEDAILAVRKANSITKPKGNAAFTISQIQDGTFVASYQVPGNPLIIPTVFPVLVVNGLLLNKKNQIYAGKFTKLNANGEPLANESLDKPVFISREQFNAMMQAGENLETGDDLLSVVDITAEMDCKFHDLLNRLEIDKFPSKVYGMLDFRKFNTDDKNAKK